MKPSVLLDYEFSVSSNAYLVRALLKLEGRAPDNTDRLPLNLSIVLDRSGSMQGVALHAARQAAALLVKRLDPKDTVSVVAFDDEVLTVAEPASGPEQAQLSKLIESIEAGGSTNLSGGWLQGREYVSQSLQQKGTNRVLLLTDGQANVGITAPDALAGFCRNALERGISTTTIGFGVSYDEHLLQGMADAGGGNMYYIETPDQAPGVFAEEIEGLLSMAAQNITVEVAPGAAVELAAVHHTYPAKETPSGLGLQVGDLYAREPKMVLMEFLVPDPKASGEAAIAECTVIANVLTSDGGVERQELSFPISHLLSREGRQDPEIRREMLLLGAARAREEALKAQFRGDYNSARRYLRDACSSFEASGAPLDDLMMDEIQDLKAMESKMNPQMFNAADAKYLNQRAYDSRRNSRSAWQRISRTSPRGRAIQYHTGDASQPIGSGPRILAYLGNDQGAWGKGFVMHLSSRWPAARDRYMAWRAGDLVGEPPFALGSVLLTEVEDELWVSCLLAQEGLKAVGGQPPVRYPALGVALEQLAAEAVQLGASVHMPRIGTGLAGGDWRRAEPLIERYLVQSGVDVWVYDLPRPPLPHA